jgi:hypothetical protein
MKTIIDTSSLLALVRYYLPFDINNTLYNHLKTEILEKRIIIVNNVIEESKYISKKIIREKLVYLFDSSLKSCLIKEDNMVFLKPPKTFFNDLDNRFLVNGVKSKLRKEEYDNLRNKFLNSADSQIILYADYLKRTNEDVQVLTEETPTSNDGKIFKKIPSICKMINVEALSLPKYLESLSDISIEVKNNLP